MKIHEKIIVAFVFITLVGCIEKNGYYEPGQQTVIDNLTGNKSWERDFHTILYNGRECDIHEIYKFKDDTSGSYRNITTYTDGEVTDKTSYFHWAFTTPNYSVIYLDFGIYWEVNELTTERLSIYETNEDITVPGQKREYKEFEAKSQINNKATAPE